jgi:ABC-type branched-subunit amino acid transport system substrate-binding protein
MGRRWRWLLLAGGLVLLASLAGTGWWRRQRPVPVAVGVDLPLVSGAAVDPSDRYTADLVLEDRRGSRIRLLNLLNDPDPASGPASIAELKRRGVRLFITTQASSHAVPSLGQFSRGDALAINVSATSKALSGHNDFFFRVVPDLVQEQRAIARALHRLGGRRVLVLYDTGNLAYTGPALAHFSAELRRLGGWQVVARPLLVSAFDPRRHRALLPGQYDALYILAGSFQPSIGNIGQLFHQLHPDAPILLTPWARSPAIVENAGPAAARIRVISPYPSRRTDPRVNRYFERFQRRFGFLPYAMGIGTHQAIELLDQALASGAETPAQVKRYLLSKPAHPTSFGPIRFDATGDVRATFHAFPAREDQAP